MLFLCLAFLKALRATCYISATCFTKHVTASQSWSGFFWLAPFAEGFGCLGEGALE
eukprot:COSAG01_NODE_913_length_12779_cov_9.134385_2_plen_56_part_00